MGRRAQLEKKKLARCGEWMSVEKKEAQETGARRRRHSDTRSRSAMGDVGFLNGQDDCQRPFARCGCEALELELELERGYSPPRPEIRKRGGRRTARSVRMAKIGIAPLSTHRAEG